MIQSAISDFPSPVCLPQPGDALSLTDDEHVLLDFIEHLPDDAFPMQGLELDLTSERADGTALAGDTNVAHGEAHNSCAGPQGVAKLDRAARVRDKNRRAQAKYRVKRKVRV
jgi:hypothetical protein